MITWERRVKAHSRALAQKCERLAGQRRFTSFRLLQPKTGLAKPTPAWASSSEPDGQDRRAQVRRSKWKTPNPVPMAA
jgi:hypothetical protein